MCCSFRECLSGDTPAYTAVITLREMCSDPQARAKPRKNKATARAICLSHKNEAMGSTPHGFSCPHFLPYDDNDSARVRAAVACVREYMHMSHGEMPTNKSVNLRDGGRAVHHLVRTNPGRTLHEQEAHQPKSSRTTLGLTSTPECGRSGVVRRLPGRMLVYPTLLGKDRLCDKTWGKNPSKSE